jgi:hypothetical protein
VKPRIETASQSRVRELDLFNLSFYMPYSRGGGGDPFRDPPIDIQIVNDPTKLPGFAGGNNDGFSPGRQSIIRINPFSAPIYADQ